jgi:hypothetical protein
MFLSNNVSNEKRGTTCFNDCGRPLSSPHGEILGFFGIQVNFNCGLGLHKKTYENEIAISSLDMLAHLIKNLSFLLQTEIYLFWTRKQQKKEGGCLGCLVASADCYSYARGVA